MEAEKIIKCVERTIQGDTKAFEELYTTTNQRVYFICLQFLKNEHDANDAVQDTYLSAYKNIRQLSEPSKFLSWVERIAVNVCKQMARKNTPVPVEDEVLFETLASDDELALPEKYIVDKEKKRILLEIMQNTLSDLQYRTIILYYFGNFTVSEIAEMMDCTDGAVKNRLATARAKIKKAIEEYQKDKDDKFFVFAGVPFLAKVFDEESKTIAAPALNTAMLTGSASAGTTASVSVGTAVKTGGIIMSKKILIGIIAGVVAVGGITTAFIIAANSGNNTIQTENSVVSMASQNESSISANSQSEVSQTVLNTDDNSDSGSTSADEVKISGKCGDNAFWTVSDEVLTISGTGYIYDYGSEEENRHPWQRFAVPTYYTVVIENGITRIGNYAFYHSDLKEITIPDSVTEIGEYAFKECGSIERIELSENVVKIGEGAFANSNLRKINIPGKVKEIPKKMCYDCLELKEITIAEGVEKIGETAFECCEMVGELKLPETLTEIDKYAFSTCRGIKKLTIPENVKTIKADAFTGWEDDQTIYVKGKSETPDGWDEDWKDENVNVIWNG